MTAARRLMPNLTLPFMARVQQAFYAENRDVTAGDEIASIAGGAGSTALNSAQPLQHPKHRTKPSAIFSPHRNSASAASRPSSPAARTKGYASSPTATAPSRATGRPAGALARRRRAGHESRCAAIAEHGQASPTSRPYIGLDSKIGSQPTAAPAYSD